MLKQTGQKPDILIQLGNMAEATLKDKALYPSFRQKALSTGINDESDLPPQPNPFTLSIYVALGKLTSEMAQTGELGA